MLNKLRTGLFYLLFFSPFLAMAQGLTETVDKIGEILAAVLPVLMLLALIYFFYGLAKYILSAGDEEKKTQGRDIMIWGIIALFVMVSVWGLVALLQRSFTPTGGPTPQSLPLIPQ